MYEFIKREEGFISHEEVTGLVKKHIADHDWKSVLLLPPDISRFHSGAGLITACYYKELTNRGCDVKVLPALGTHLPMTEEQLDEMIQSTKAYKLMSGARGMAKSDITAMKDTIRKIVKISVECPEIKELEINPVIVGDEGKGCWAVDALVTLI